MTTQAPSLGQSRDNAFTLPRLKTGEMWSSPDMKAFIFIMLYIIQNASSSECMRIRVYVEQNPDKMTFMYTAYD